MADALSDGPHQVNIQYNEIFVAFSEKNIYFRFNELNQIKGRLKPYRIFSVDFILSIIAVPIAEIEAV